MAGDELGPLFFLTEELQLCDKPVKDFVEAKTKSEKRLFNKCKDVYSFKTCIFPIVKKALKDQSLKALSKKIKNKQSLNLPTTAGLLVLSLSYIFHLHTYLKIVTCLNC